MMWELRLLLLFARWWNRMNVDVMQWIESRAPLNGIQFNPKMVLILLHMVEHGRSDFCAVRWGRRRWWWSQWRRNCSALSTEMMRVKEPTNQSLSSSKSWIAQCVELNCEVWNGWQIEIGFVNRPWVVMNGKTVLGAVEHLVGRNLKAVRGKESKVSWVLRICGVDSTLLSSPLDECD